MNALTLDRITAFIRAPIRPNTCRKCGNEQCQCNRLRFVGEHLHEFTVFRQFNGQFERLGTVMAANSVAAFARARKDWSFVRGKPALKWEGAL